MCVYIHTHTPAACVYTMKVHVCIYSISVCSDVLSLTTATALGLPDPHDVFSPAVSLFSPPPSPHHTQNPCTAQPEYTRDLAGITCPGFTGTGHGWGWWRIPGTLQCQLLGTCGMMQQALAQQDKTACGPAGPGLAGTVYWQPRYKELGYVRARKRQCKPSMAQLGGCPPHTPRSHQFRWDTTQHCGARLPCLVRGEPTVSAARGSAERSQAVLASVPQGQSTTSQLRGIEQRCSQVHQFFSQPGTVLALPVSRAWLHLATPQPALHPYLCVAQASC